MAGIAFWTSSLLLAVVFQDRPEVTVAGGKAEQRAEEPFRIEWKGFEKPPDEVLEYRYRVEMKDGAGAEVVRKNTSTKLRTQTRLRTLVLEPKQEYRAVVQARYKSKPTVFADPILSPWVKISVPAENEKKTAAETPEEELMNFIGDAAGLSGKRKPGDELGESVVKALEDPATLNSVLKSLLQKDPGIKLLKDLKLEFKALQANEGETVLGLGFSYDKVVTELPFDLTATHGLDLRVEAEGTLAFDREKNPEDFQAGSVGLDFFASFGGSTGKGNTITGRLMNELEDQLVAIKDRSELDRSDAWKKYDRLLQNFVETQYYFDLRIDAGIESNQGGTDKQYVFEAKLGLDIKAWDETEPLAWLNVFDWPFAAIRLLTGYDDEWRVRGATIPVVLVGFGRVNPFDEDPRSDVGDKTDFWRFSAKAGFRTPVGRVAGSTVHFDAAYRYYLELDPSDEVRNADLHEFRYYTLALTSSTGVFVSYSAGQLPFDAEKDQIYEAGLRVAF